LILEPVDWSRRRMNELSETPQVRSCKEAHGRARGKHSARSANQQPKFNTANIKVERNDYSNGRNGYAGKNDSRKSRK
jgi:hypothetical protein